MRRLVEKNWGCICIKKSLCVQNASAALSPPLILPTPVSHFNLCLSYNTISPHNHRICSRFTWKKWKGLSGEIESEEKNKMMQIEKESFSKQRWLVFSVPFLRLTTGGSICRTCILGSGPPLPLLLLRPRLPYSQPLFTVPWRTATEILLMGSFLINHAIHQTKQ